MYTGTRYVYVVHNLTLWNFLQNLFVLGCYVVAALSCGRSRWSDSGDTDQSRVNLPFLGDKLQSSFTDPSFRDAIGGIIQKGNNDVRVSVVYEHTFWRQPNGLHIFTAFHSRCAPLDSRMTNGLCLFTKELQSRTLSG